MTNNNTSTLFHFTKKRFIPKILKDGLRVTYCKEQFLDTVLGIPMISFCDIPLSRTDEHRKKYGNYAIGFDKEKMLKNEVLKKILNPIIYCNSDILEKSIISFSEEYEDIKQKIDNLTQETESSNIILCKKGISSAIVAGKKARSLRIKSLSNNILGFTKHYKGIGKKNKEIIFYDECEWRIIIPENNIQFQIAGKPCKWLQNEEEYNKWRGNGEKKFLNDVSFGEADVINYLIVNKEEEIPWLIDIIWKDLFMKEKIDKDQKKILISKITSFERIKKDY